MKTIGLNKQTEGNVKINIVETAIKETEVQLLIAGFFEEDFTNTTEYKEIGELTGQALQNSVNKEDFVAKSGQLLPLYSINKSGPRHIIVLGLGKKGKITPEKIRRAYGSAGKYARGKSFSDVCVISPDIDSTDCEFQYAVSAALEGTSLALYRYVRHSRKLDKKPIITEMKALNHSNGNAATFKKAVFSAEAGITGNYFARDLAVTPGMDLYPESYAKMAEGLADENITVKILKVNDLKKLGMGGILAVGQGSAQPPVLIHMIYEPAEKASDCKTLAVVGKGVTFDSGGLDIKPADGMRDMKIDMAGSAAVLGFFKSIGQIKPNCRIEGFVAAAENMTGSFAYRPGDILKSYKGLTIEVDNTDAEGRLTLADALAYANEVAKPDAIIDLATLTGACWIALGHHATGLMGTSDELAKELSKAGFKTGERVWELPIWEEYEEQISSEVADLKNTGGRPGGAITAAAFLKEFVDDTPWVHLDIAGTASEVPVSYAPHKELPTGVGVRLLLEFVKNWS